LIQGVNIEWESTGFGFVLGSLDEKSILGVLWVEREFDLSSFSPTKNTKHSPNAYEFP